MRTVYITPTSAFPRTLPSNTLFGAICSAMAELGGPVGDLVAAFEEDPPFLLTSAFPWFGEEEKVHLLPAPILPPEKLPGEALFDAAKKLRKVSYLQSGIFASLVEGRLSDDEILRDLDRGDGKYRIGSGMLYEKKQDHHFEISRSEIPHNRINRLSVASEAFFASEGFRFSNAGLYFLIDFKEKAWENEVLAALRLLADRGFGPKVSSGQGACSISFGDTDILPTSTGERIVTLSRYLPDDFDLLGEDAFYNLVRIRGRSADGVMKRSVMMLGEGSVFPDTGDDVYGGIARVRDDPPVVEYGYAFPIRFRSAA
ncbi:hypothetical protein RJ53_09405 [Methanocalculus chunghsingensis]|uniref:CRISPR system Cms protein Csm4 n=1 Tax=Methanocalculus chunghsingensis TaxID=156457 RepID=A0A8J7W765_9EURY|nr:type III-A CRISPR-associated RAMP protein Csm4 [Methanocalculus chunghsingensis]MBR1369679.1 hypothetical protein [Methanocalculus chunghsingensis]